MALVSLLLLLPLNPPPVVYVSFTTPLVTLCIELPYVLLDPPFIVTFKGKDLLVDTHAPGSYELFV